MTDGTTRRVALLMEPLDVLFFRDGRPFEAGFRGETGLPTPQVFAGMVRSHLLHAAGVDLRRLNAVQRQHPSMSLAAALRETGGPSWIGEVKCRGSWLYKEGPLVPLPADLVTEGKKGGSPRLLRLRPLPQETEVPGWHGPSSGMRPLWIGEPGAAPEHPEGGWLDPHGLQEYLKGETPGTFIRRDTLFCFEDRTGVGIDADRLTAREHLLYSARFLRLRWDVLLYGEVELPSGAPAASALFPDGLTLPMGGEGRRVRVRRVEPFTWPKHPPERGRLLTLLITPGLFSGVDQPTWRPNREVGRLVAAAVPGQETVSGWDVARRRPKPTRYAVPAGSVYLWEANREPALAEDTLCDGDDEAKAGWGLFVRGAWKYHG